MKIMTINFVLISLFLMSCKAREAAIVEIAEVEKTNNTEQQNTYRNPVLNKSVPDPTIIKAENGSFYIYGTEDIRNTPIYKSDDLVNWEFVGTAFTDDTRPNFEPNGGLWAPDINFINGKYVLYYSMSVWGGEWTCGIGVATADKPEGPFTDHGKLFRSNEIQVQNSIDQFYIEEGGKKYLFWGSFRGIYYIELSDDGLSVKAGAEKMGLIFNDDIPFVPLFFRKESVIYNKYISGITAPDSFQIYKDIDKWYISKTKKE